MSIMKKILRGFMRIDTLKFRDLNFGVLISGGAVKSNWTEWYFIILDTGGKKILEYFNHFCNPLAVISAGYRKFSLFALKGILGMLFLMSIFAIDDANAAPCSGASCPWFELLKVSGPVNTFVDNRDSYDRTVIRYRLWTVTSFSTYMEYVVSERTNGGNWTHSAKKRGDADRSDYTNVGITQAIRMNVPMNPLGNWYITGANTHNANLRYTFVPDKNAVNRITKGNQVEVRIEVKLFRSGENVKTHYFHVGFHNYESTTVSWEANNNPQIVPDGSSTYEEIDGQITNKPVFAVPLKLGGYEVKPDGTKTSATVGNTRELTSKYSGWDVPVGENFQYGFWVISRNNDKFLFRPNSAEINKLLDNQIVVSAFEVTPHDDTGNPVGGKSTIRVVIGKYGIGVDWDNDIELDSEGNPIITIDHTSEYDDLHATLGVVKPVGDYYHGGADEFLNRQMKIVGSNNAASGDLDAENLPPGFVKNDTRVYGRGWSTGSGEHRGGVWFFDGKKELVTFRPIKDRLEKLNAGDFIESYLTLYLVRGGESSRTTLATKTLKVTIKRANPVKVGINDIELDEGTGAVSTEFLFKVSIESETAIGETFTVPVTFSHGSTNDDDFATGQDFSSLNAVFGPGDTEVSIPIAVNQDMDAETDETFTLKLSEPTGDAKDNNFVTLDTELGANVGTGIIIDDDRAQVSIDDISKAEGNGGGTTEFQFTVSLSPATALNQTFTVPISFAHVTTNGGDFVNDPTQVDFDVSFGATDTTVMVNVIMVNGDGDGEEQESFALRLSEPTGDAKNMDLVTLSRMPGSTVGLGTITDDDSKNLTSTWLTGFDGSIVSDGFSDQYGYQVGHLTDNTFVPTNFKIRFNVTERENNTVINSATPSGHNTEQLPRASLDDSLYSEFAGSDSNIYKIDDKFTYGHWYVRFASNNCSVNWCNQLLFVPNSTTINQLRHGDAVESTFNRTLWNDSGDFETSSITVTITAEFGTNLIGFDFDSRSIEIGESDSAVLGVSIPEGMTGPTTIPFTVLNGTAELHYDFSLPASSSLTIPDGETYGTITIPIIDNSTNEENEYFTVSLSDGENFTVTPALHSATVTIFDNDPLMITEPAGKCHEVAKPSAVATPNTEIYWEIGAPEEDGNPVVYRRAGDAFNVRLGFRDPATKAGSTPNSNNTFYFGIFYINGNAENPSIPKIAQSTWGGVGHRISQPGSFRGYLRYRILPRNTTDNSWYHVGDPCEFHIWWTDSDRPGITLSTDATVNEGKSFRVMATATPAPNRDILVPVTLSDTSRIVGSENFNIRIRSGQTSGHVDVPTKFQPGDQAADDVTASTEWRSSYWLDDSKKSATVTILDHDRKFVKFKNSNPDITVGESGTAELVVVFDGTNPSGVAVKYRIDNVETDASDYTAPSNTEINIASGTEGTISIPISSDTNFENSESFTVTLVESNDTLPADSNFIATVTIISDDPPMPSLPTSGRCDNVTQPMTTTTVNTQAYWKLPLPDIYQKTNDRFAVRMGFRDPTTKQDGNIMMPTLFKIGTYLIDGTVHNDSDSIGRTPTTVTDHLDFPLPSPRDFTGYLRYRIIQSNEIDDNWYDIGTPCEFAIWWTDANKPGITISVDKESVLEGNSFKVVATATPEPNRDILIPVTLSDISRIEGSQNYTIRIGTGRSSGNVDIQTKFIQGDQTVNDLTATAEWRSSYWLDESVNTAAISILETALPVLSISAGGSVTEANNTVATFNVSSNIAIETGEIEVNYTVAETGDFLLAPDPADPSVIGHNHNVPRNAIMDFTDRSAAGDGSGPFIHTLEIPLRDNDDLNSGPQSVTVTLNIDTDGTHYELSAAASASVIINDDESLPVLTFEADSNIAEFDEPNSADTVKNIAFMVTATAATNPGTLSNVRYTPSETGNFIDDANGNTPDAPTQVALNFSGSGGKFTAPLEIPIDPDDDPEATGSVTVTLLNAEGVAFSYKLGGDAAKHSWTVTVYDNDIPELTIKAPALQFIEGTNEEIAFTVTARFNVDSTMSVNFNVEEFSPSDLDTPLLPHSYVEPSFSSPKELEFNGGRTATLGVPIANDTDSESDRVVRITLTTGSSPEYTVANIDTGNRAEIRVVDDDGAPSISLSAPESVKESDGSIAYTVSSFQDPGSTLEIGFTLTEGEGNEYLSAEEEAKNSVNLSLEDADGDGIFSNTFAVNLTDDDTGEPTGVITLTLAESTDIYRLDESTKTAIVKVYDDDVPEIRFADDSSSDSVLEVTGAKANFKIVASFMPDSPLSVHYTPVGANFLAAGSSGVNLTAALSFSDESTTGEGPFTANLEVPVDNDEMAEADGPITVTLNADEPVNETYTVDAENSEASVVIRDDDSLTFLTVSGPESVLESNGEAVFLVTARAPANPGAGYDVAYAVSQNGNFLNSQYAASQSGRHTEGLNFTASGSTYTANLTINLNDDGIGERTGSVTVRLEMNASGTSDYGLGGKIEHTIKVYDDDAPLIWIDSVEDNVVAAAGAMTRFMLRSRSPVSAAITYRVEESSFIDASYEGMQTTTGGFENPAGSSPYYTKQFDIPLLDTGTGKDSFGEVTVTLLNGEVGNNPVYTVATDDPENPNSATVQIFNVSTGTPFASVSSGRNAVTEGEEIVFSVAIIPEQQQDVRVNLQVSQQGDFIPWPMPDSVIVPPAGMELKIPTIDTDAVASGTVTVEILPGPGYQPGRSKSVMVNDNDAPNPKYSVAANVIEAILMQIPAEGSNQENQSPQLEVSIEAVRGNVAEGESVEFVIAAGKEPVNRTEVNIGLRQQGDFVSGPMRRSVVLEIGQAENVLLVATADDELAEDDGRIIATIESGSGYRVSSLNTAHVTVSDSKDRQNRKTRVANALHTVLPNLLAQSTAKTLDITTKRVELAFSGNPATSIELNGKSPAMSMLQSGGEMLNGTSTDWRSLIDNSSFTVALYPEGGETSPATLWGVGDRWSLSNDGIGGQHSWDGETYAGHFGFDTAVGQNVLTGFAVSVSQTGVGYELDRSSVMSFDTHTTGIHPYLGYASPDGKSKMQFITGYGVNELVLHQEAYSPEILSGNYHTVGLSGNRSIYSKHFGEGHNMALRFAGAAWHSSQSLTEVDGLVDGLQVSARHVRIAMEGVHEHNLSNGYSVSPTISIGMRTDSRNENSVFGLDVNSGVKLHAFDGLEVLGSGKTLLSGLNRVRSWLIESSFDYDSASDGKGILLKYAQSRSGTDANVERYIWSSELVDASNDSFGSHKVDSIEIGYGFAAMNGSALITPYSAFNQTNSHGIELQIGSRLKTRTGINLELEAVRDVSATGAIGYDFNLIANFNW